MLKVEISTILFTAIILFAHAKKRIVNGWEPLFGEHPYICSLQELDNGSFKHLCGCVIYNVHTVLTAAHCLQGNNPALLRVQAGVHNISKPDDHLETVLVTNFTIHSQYNQYLPGIPNDIGTVEVAPGLIFNDYIRPPKFDTYPSTDWTGHICRVSGWGITSLQSNKTSDTLRAVNMRLISNAECKFRWEVKPGTDVNAGHVCNYDPPSSSCASDGGGPVSCGDMVVGLTSWGGVCDGILPSVATRIGYFYDWIKAHAYS